MTAALKIIGGFIGGFIGVSLVTGLIAAITGHDSITLSTIASLAGGVSLATYWASRPPTPPTES